ncbi:MULTISPECIES: hypothetical protein, partial [unclassified Desulfovibrio]|uniref:hypothetical protein n=1 Tax=unclassified Desulfovibrio TaxID=2593640 RepID=UPI001C89CDBC
PAFVQPPYTHPIPVMLDGQGEIMHAKKPPSRATSGRDGGSHFCRPAYVQEQWSIRACSTPQNQRKFWTAIGQVTYRKEKDSETTSNEWSQGDGIKFFRG